MLFISAHEQLRLRCGARTLQQKLGNGVCRLEHHQGFHGSVFLEEEVCFLVSFCGGERAACALTAFFPLADALRFSEQRRAFSFSPSLRELGETSAAVL